jgi:phosphoglycolate phosphatase-like HAD superfamily hydrolase
MDTYFNSSKSNLNILNKSLYIFDFDGVLVDSVEIKTNAFAEIYKKYGSKVVEKIIDHHRFNGGMSRIEKFHHYHKEFLGHMISQDEIKQLSHDFSRLVVEKVIKANEIEGVSYILRFCKQNNIMCAIASATPDLELQEIVSLRGWKDVFVSIYGSPDSKAKNIEKILIASNTPKSNAIFFGDSINDLDAAKFSDVDFFGINYYSGDNKGFREFMDLIK